MALFPDPFGTLLRLQQALDTFRTSDWLEPSPSAAGSYPPINVFRKGDDYIVIAEVPGVGSSDLQVQVKNNTFRLAGRKAVNYPEGVSLHRRERMEGRFDRTLTLPIQINADAVKAECRDGILALLLPRAEHDKPRTIKLA
jgi:HSP20 family protein